MPDEFDSTDLGTDDADTAVYDDEPADNNNNHGRSVHHYIGHGNLVRPDDLFGDCIEFHQAINISTVRVFHAGAVYRLLPDDD